MSKLIHADYCHGWADPDHDFAECDCHVGVIEAKDAEIVKLKDDYKRVCNGFNAMVREVERGYATPEEVAAKDSEIAALRAQVIDLRMAEAQAMSLVVSHEGRISALTAEVEQLRASLDVQDDRLQYAAHRTGLEFGCDAAEHMADEVERLRAQLAAKGSR